MAKNISTDEVVVLGDESINSNVMRQTQFVQPKVTKERKKRSRAWNHFGSFVDEEGNKKSKCKHCGQDYFADSVKNGFQSVQGGNTSDVVVVSWKFEQEQCRRALCRMVIVDELPFKFVEKEGFRNFMKVAQPHFKIPSRTTVTRDCFKLFDEEKQKLKRFFGEARQDHKVEDMANKIIKCLCDWSLDKIFTITVDNASSNGVTVKERDTRLFSKKAMGVHVCVGPDEPVQASEHAFSRSTESLWLAPEKNNQATFFFRTDIPFFAFPALTSLVEYGLKVSVVSIERVRKAVKYIRLSPARCKRAIEFENVFSSYVARDIGLLHYLQFVEDEDGSVVGALLSDDRDNFGKEGPILEKGVRDYMDLLFGEYVKSLSKDKAIPISSVASECAFSTGRRILDSFRSSLTPKLVQTLVCLQDWIRSESRPISVEEDIDILEQLEQDLTNTSILDD
ncbi:hypothetical protein KY289_009669 [Solanum tuberosum]|nr:hypothetical protein KY289_009669 [Solanum tuberosum]